MPNPNNLEWQTEKEQHYLLFKYWRDRIVLQSDENCIFLESDFVIKVPLKFKYRVFLGGGNHFLFLYGDNQAIIINNPSRQMCKKISTLPKTNDTLYVKNFTDTVFVPSMDEANKIAMEIANENDIQNKHYQRMSNLILNVEFEDYPKGRKNLMIYKNGVRILLFNAKEKNIDKWVELVQQIEVFPMTIENVKKDKRIQEWLQQRE
jgi:hypothetical protein